jgi:hypothetical protein
MYEGKGEQAKRQSSQDCVKMTCCHGHFKGADTLRDGDGLVSNPLSY